MIVKKNVTTTSEKTTPHPLQGPVRDGEGVRKVAGERTDGSVGKHGGQEHEADPKDHPEVYEPPQDVAEESATPSTPDAPDVVERASGGSDDAGRSPHEQEDRKNGGERFASALIRPCQHGLYKAGTVRSERVAEPVHDQALGGVLSKPHSG